MKYPVPAIMTGLSSAIATKIPGRTVTEIPTKDLAYPYIWLSQPFVQEIGPKPYFMYEVEILLQIVHKNLDKMTNLQTDMNSVLDIIKNGSDITATGYTVIAVELISANQTTEMTDSGRLEIGLVRMKIILQ